jgi:hypothetical protein
MESVGACYEESQKKLKMLDAICSLAVKVKNQVVLCGVAKICEDL